MAEEKEEAKFGMDEEAVRKLLTDAHFVRKGKSILVDIDGKQWHIRSTSMRQNDIMSGMDFDVMYMQGQLKEARSAKAAKRLNTKIRKIYAKKAAHKVLGRRLRWVPFLYNIMWRRIYNSTEAVSATINATETVGENKVFYLANLGSSKQTLILSTMQVGDAIEQRIKRGESAENMVEKDASPKKADSK